MTTPYSKKSVTFHGTGYAGPGVPAVNVKVGLCRIPLPLDLGSYSDDGGVTFRTTFTEPDFDWDWIDANVSGDSAFDVARMSGWEQLREEATNIFGDHVNVWSEGRSGGWAWVEGIKAFDDWDAVDLGKWRRFERYARALADDIPRQMVELIYFNEWASRNDVAPDPVLVVADALDGLWPAGDGVAIVAMDEAVIDEAASTAVTALRDAGLLPEETA